MCFFGRGMFWSNCLKYLENKGWFWFEGFFKVCYVFVFKVLNFVFDDGKGMVIFEFGIGGGILK